MGAGDFEDEWVRVVFEVEGPVLVVSVAGPVEGGVEVSCCHYRWRDGK